MNAVELDDLSKLFLKKEQILSFINENKDFLSPFICHNNGITNVALGETGGSFQSTSTGFAFYYITSLLKLPNGSGLHSKLIAELKVLVDSHFQNLCTNFLNDHKSIVKTQTGDLPNNYNTPIQIAGILSSKQCIANLELPLPCKEYIDELFGENDGFFLNRLHNNKGFIGRIGSESIPSPYLTFWVLESISLNDEIYKTNHLNEIYDEVAKWATDSLSKAISFSYSGLSQSFDAIEVSYLLLILLSLLKNQNVNRSESSSIYNGKKLIEHSIDILFSKYFSAGCFTKSLPVFADANNFSLSCPTVEPLSLLIIKHPEYFYNHCSKLSEIYDWLLESKFRSSNNKPWTWRSEWEHHSNKPTSFMAISCFTFLVGFQKYIDFLLADKATDILGVLPFYKDADNESIKYPGGLGEIVRDFIIRPIESGKKDLAHFSVILFGPPGTSKTTISKKIAQDLKWPLLIVNANTFLKSGIEKIDFEAERIFKLVSYLENVVILFDEVEELVLNRDSDSVVHTDQRSRLLTTSMLPRINDLRSTCRVVFIFATNYLNHIDNAISRTGRFDCVHCVMPPDEVERKNILESILKKNNIDDQNPIYKTLLNKANLKATHKFCYSDLRDLIKRIIVRTEGIGSDIESIISNEIEVGKHATIEDEDFLQFSQKKEKLDRPKPSNYKL